MPKPLVAEEDEGSSVTDSVSTVNGTGVERGCHGIDVGSCGFVLQEENAFFEQGCHEGQLPFRPLVTLLQVARQLHLHVLRRTCVRVMQRPTSSRSAFVSAQHYAQNSGAQLRISARVLSSRHPKRRHWGEGLDLDEVFMLLYQLYHPQHPRQRCAS